MVGSVVGNYQIVRKLGEGGMGAVYLGQHTLLGRRAAIKVLLPALSARPDVVNRFFNEARAVTSISDPGIVQVFDFGYHTDGSAFIVMELLEGEALDARLRRVGRFDVPQALRLGRQVAASLAVVHERQIVHRDLKPENIFLVRDAEVASGERSKILDFGIAKLSEDQSGTTKTRTGMLIGTPLYMSPEQCRGLSDLDHRSDIYALGCVMFQMLVGRPPFESEHMGDLIAAHIREPAPPPSSLATGIGPEVDGILLRCLAKAPDDRFQSMHELANAISQLLPHMTSPLTQAASSQGWQPAHGPNITPVSPTTSPTTLGSSVGQVATISPAAGARWRLAAVLITLASATAITISTVRSGGHEAQPASAPTPNAAPVAPPILDAPALALTPDASSSLDAGAPAMTLDAVVPADGTVVVPDAGVKRTVRPPKSRSGRGVTPPAGCDRAIDTDCDGIPDVR